MIPDPVTKSDVSSPNDNQLNCNAVDCNQTQPDTDSDHVVPDCPADSLPAPLRHDSADSGGLCCEPPTTRLACQCLPCDRADQTACGPSQLKVLVEEARGSPGHCCDVYQCVDHCESNELSRRLVRPPDIVCRRTYILPVFLLSFFLFSSANLRGR